MRMTAPASHTACAARSFKVKRNGDGEQHVRGEFHNVHSIERAKEELFVMQIKLFRLSLAFVLILKFRIFS